MKNFIASVVCAVGLAVLFTGMPVDTESSIRLPTSEFHTSEKSFTDLNALLAPVCKNMTPIHNVSVAQTVASPYHVTVDKTMVAEGGVVTVTVSGGDFKGIFLEARNDKDNLVGTFAPATSNLSFIVSCRPGTNNAFFFESKQSVTELALKWVAPKTAETVRFRCTTAKDFYVFWVGDESSEVQVTGSE